MSNSRKPLPRSFYTIVSHSVRNFDSKSKSSTRGGKCIGPWDHWSQKILGFPEKISNSHLQNI